MPVTAIVDGKGWTLQEFFEIVEEDDILENLKARYEKDFEIRYITNTNPPLVCIHEADTKKFFAYITIRTRGLNMWGHVTREMLIHMGKCVVDNVNHEEYIMEGYRYFVMWISPQESTNEAGGWLVYDRKEVKDEESATTI